jgi:starch-binding outer membrane protein, SusD/RagB family
MNKTLNRPNWLLAIVAAIIIVPMGFVLQSCTNLDEDTFGIVTPDQFYKTDEEILAGLAPIYSQLRALMWNWQNLSQISSDETVVPTRGSDWFDGGRWLAIHRQTWDAGLTDFNGAWNDAFTGIARANGLLGVLAESSDQELLAEIRFLRAWYYYTLMDFFGNIPVVEGIVDADNPPSNKPRAEVFDFIVAELQFAVANLPATRPASSYGRVTSGSANALLANMYLNAEIFRGTLTGSGITRAPGQWQDAINSVDAVINSGQYSLATSFFDNFSPTNENSPELIFIVAHLAAAGLGMNLQMRPLHYNQFTPSPWNGFSTLASIYNKFEPTDKRRSIFLIGQQINFITGEEVTDRPGNPLIFTATFNNIEDAAEGEGIRPLKFPVDLNSAGADHGNDYPFFRLAEMFLIKAEAMNELSGPSAGAVDLVNQLRERAFDPADYVPLQAGDFTQESFRDMIMDERVRELSFEAKRRQDMVRAGTFSSTWEFKTNTDPWRVVFPIPQVQLDSNPNLTQNPGY